MYVYRYIGYGVWVGVGNGEQWDNGTRIPMCCVRMQARMREYHGSPALVYRFKSHQSPNCHRPGLPPLSPARTLAVVMARYVGRMGMRTCPGERATVHLGRCSFHLGRCPLT